MTERVLIANAGVPCPGYLLDSDEQALWWDRPDPSCYARQQAGRAVFVGVFFVGIASFMVVKAIEGGSYFGALFCACFVAVGLYAMSEPLRRYFQARDVVYLLTDKRAVVADERVVKSVSIPLIKAIEVTRTAGPFADVLYFDRVVKGDENGDTFVRDGFIGITEAEAVGREMRRLQAAAP
jgi:hypothetical protein